MAMMEGALRAARHSIWMAKTHIYMSFPRKQSQKIGFYEVASLRLESSRWYRSSRGGGGIPITTGGCTGCPGGGGYPNNNWWVHRMSRGGGGGYHY